MPELIDLEIMSENIRKSVSGRKLGKIEIHSSKVLQNCESLDVSDSLEGQKLTDCKRKSKFLVFEFENKAKLVVHLMLHGNLCWLSEEPKPRSVVCSLDFENGEGLLIKDWSSWMKIELDDDFKSISSPIFNDEYGVDPLSADFSTQKLEEILQRRSRANIKSVLMDQKEFAGIGNAYADESLFCARIHPMSRAGAIVKADKTRTLYNAIKSTLDGALDKVRSLAGGKSVKEQPRDFMEVYRKSGEKCPVCGYMIAQLKVNGRDTFVCEKCQQKL